MSIGKHDISLTAAKVLRRIPGAAPIARQYNAKRHQAISNELNDICKQAYADANVSTLEEATNNGPIWVLWWQGIDQAPEVVRACVQSIQRNANGRQVVVITRDNVRNYVQLPEYIFDKVAAGLISLTQFSDILRFNLLHRHGGLWMDATLFVTAPLDLNRCFGSFFTCSGFADPANFFISAGRWTGFFIGGNSSEPLFDFMDSLFQTYWKTHGKLIDYFLIDYALDYAYRHRIGSLYAWSTTQKGQDNPQLFDLAPLLAQPFDVHRWESLTADTSVFKLSWKKDDTFPAGSFGSYILSEGAKTDS